MPVLTLTPGKVESLKVVGIRDRQKQVKKKDGLMYHVFNVKLEDKNGCSVEAEYLTKNKELLPFVVGVFQYIRCGIIGTVGVPEIEPAEEPGPGQMRTVPLNATVDTREEPGGDVSGKDVGDTIYSVQVSGKSITFAFGYSKDLKVAEIAQQPVGYRITEQDVQDVVDWANIINDGIVRRVQF